MHRSASDYNQPKKGD